MENASKALIIAGAILISILLISVGILIFNSISGITDNASTTDDAMELAAALENAKIILDTMDIENDNTFNNYIKSKYEERDLTATEVRELAALIIERTKKITGLEYNRNETHFTTQSGHSVRWDNEKYCYDLKDDKLYSVTFGEKGDGILGIYITEKSN